VKIRASLSRATAKPLLRRASLAVVLQVDLDALAQPRKEIEECIFICQAHAVGIEQDSRDWKLAEPLDQFANLRMHGRLAAREHHDVEAPVLALERGRDGVDGFL
jgi:hypothetical protein